MTAGVQQERQRCLEIRYKRAFRIEDAEIRDDIAQRI